MLFQEPTPDTTNFLILGFVAFAVLGGGFVISLVVRFRNLRRDEATLEPLLHESQE